VSEIVVPVDVKEVLDGHRRAGHRRQSVLGRGGSRSPREDGPPGSVRLG